MQTPANLASKQVKLQVTLACPSSYRFIPQCVHYPGHSRTVAAEAGWLVLLSLLHLLLPLPQWPWALTFCWAT